MLKSGIFRFYAPLRIYAIFNAFILPSITSGFLANLCWYDASISLINVSLSITPLHSNIYTPDYVVVVDETLLSSVDVTAGIKRNGAIIINTPKSREEIAEKLEGYEGRIYTASSNAAVFAPCPPLPCHLTSIPLFIVIISFYF